MLWQTYKDHIWFVSILTPYSHYNAQKLQVFPYTKFVSKNYFKSHSMVASRWLISKLHFATEQSFATNLVHHRTLLELSYFFSNTLAPNDTTVSMMIIFVNCIQFFIHTCSPKHICWPTRSLFECDVSVMSVFTLCNLQILANISVSWSHFKFWSSVMLIEFNYCEITLHSGVEKPVIWNALSSAFFLLKLSFLLLTDYPPLKTWILLVSAQYFDHLNSPWWLYFC